jgi:hypothetical protein
MIRSTKEVRTHDFNFIRVSRFGLFLSSGIRYIMAARGPSGVGPQGLVIVISVCAIAANDAWHFGMHETTSTTTTALVGKTVVKHKLGTNGKMSAYGFATAAGQQKAVPNSHHLHEVEP